MDWQTLRREKLARAASDALRGKEGPRWRVLGERAVDLWLRFCAFSWWEKGLAVAGTVLVFILIPVALLTLASGSGSAGYQLSGPPAKATATARQVRPTATAALVVAPSATRAAVAPSQPPAPPPASTPEGPGPSPTPSALLSAEEAIALAVWSMSGDVPLGYTVSAESCTASRIAGLQWTVSCQAVLPGCQSPDCQIALTVCIIEEPLTIWSC